MNSDTGDTTSLAPGYPIRTSSDQRSVDNSPRHIAASHVLHRLLMPRHPPCALTHLHTKNTRQKTNNSFLFRCSQPLSNTQTPHPTTKAGRHHKSVLSQSPIVCRQSFRPGTKPRPDQRLLCTQPAATTATDSFTASPAPNARAFSWCSLERR
jgi:hypothetical protein